jgi:hypothetical protein
MRFCLAVLVLIPAPLLFAGEDTPEALFRETMKAFQEARSLLTAVKDKATAEAARPKLLALGKRLEKLKERGTAIEQDPAKKKRMAELARKSRQELKGILNGMSAEVERIGGLPGARAALRDVPFLEPAFALAQARRDRAKADLQVLTQALDAYAVLNNGSYPESLEVLTQNKGDQKALVTPKALLDPWGRPYVYEPTTLHPTTGRPLVYSQGPRPGDKAGRIRNWTAPKDK